jgi:hypothetical protein
MSDDSYHEKNYNDIYTNINDTDAIRSKALKAANELIKKKDYKKSTTNRRADFEYMELEKVNFMKSMMLILYILVVIGLAYTLFLNTDIDKRTKGLILTFFTLYPVLFIPIILYFYNTIVYVLSLMTGNIYKKTDF